MAPTGFGHGRVELHVGMILSAFAREHRLGEVVVGEVLFQLDTAAHVARAADVAFLRHDRVPTDPLEAGAYHGAPDLAVEFVSPSESAENIQHKIVDWLEFGTSLVLMIYPTTRQVALWNRNGGAIFRGDAEISLDPVLTGFRCRASDLFPPARENQD